MFKIFFCIKLSLVLSLSSVIAQSSTHFFDNANPHQKRWVDSVFRKLNKKERIGQLFFLRAHTNLGKSYEDSVAALIKQDKVGGLVFFQGGPGRQSNLTKYYQSISEVPLLIAQDAEWGLGMRLDSTISYPYQMTLGAIQDNQLIYEMGREIAKDFKKINAHLNFAPVVDINNNPRNPVINYRSFGDNKLNVAEKAKAYLTGLQDESVLASLKHFPGHGDTDVDSHNDLPILNFTAARLDSLELYPFKQLLPSASGIMVAHMNIPALDNTPNLPSTLSKPIVSDLLKQKLGFNGLVISDAMEMKGVVKHFKDGEADVRAIIAGNDVIELSENTHRSIKLTRKAIRQGRLKWEQVNESVRKILAAKYWAGAHKPAQTADSAEIAAFMTRPEALNLKQRLADASVTVLKSDSLLKALNSTDKTAIISLGVTDVSLFQLELNKRFPNSTNFVLSKIASAADISNIRNELKSFRQVIVAIHDYRKRPLSTLDFNPPLKQLVAELSTLNTLTCLFANPYTLADLPGVERSKTLLINYQNNDEAQKASAKTISGEMAASGRLPVTINALFKTGDGISYFPVPAATIGNATEKTKEPSK